MPRAKAQNIDVASAFESFIEDHKIKDIFDRRFEAVFQNLDNITKLSDFDDSGEFKLITTYGEEIDVVDEYNDFDQEFECTFDNQHPNTYIKHFHTAFSIREFAKKKYKPITHKCVNDTEAYIANKLDNLIQRYHNKYSPLHIFKADESYILHSKKHIVYIDLLKMKTDEEYYSTFDIILNIYCTNDMSKLPNFTQDLKISKKLMWNVIYDHNMYDLKLDAIMSWEFEPEITNRILKLTQQNRTYSTRDLNKFILPSPKTSPKTSPTELSRLLSKMTVKELKGEAGLLGLQNISRLRKAELVKALTGAKTRSPPK